tara:strand:- start:271 stop:693 length:423 start_codon:yes stop_codon:yes gene_type:complete
MDIVENISDLSLNYFSLIRKLSSKFELTLSQALILLYIPFDGITVSDLSNKLGVDISTMTRNIQRIEKKLLINKKPNINDKRSIKLVLSSRGKEISNAINKEISNNIDSIISKYDIEEHHKIKNSIESLSWHLYLHRENL